MQIRFISRFAVGSILRDMAFPNVKNCFVGPVKPKFPERLNLLGRRCEVWSPSGELLTRNEKNENQVWYMLQFSFYYVFVRMFCAEVLFIRMSQC
jgi:hypothetical protein